MGLSWLWQRDLVLVLVLVMVTSSAIELTGDNVCPRVENYTVTLRERYEEPVIVNSVDWCFEIPPRCPRSRTEIRERWRNKTETRQRKVSDCCEGYVIKKATKGEGPITEDSATGKCEPRCDSCQYGNCVAPNTCVCGPGRLGEGCANDSHQSEGSPTSATETSSSEISVDPVVLQIGNAETSSIPTSTVTTNYGNYNGHRRVEWMDTKVPRVKKPSTSRPIVAVVHVSGNGSPGHDGPMIMTSMNAEKVPTHVVPMPLDVVALIVVGSIISLGLTTLAVLAILHIRSRLFETIRLSIYDAEKRHATNGTLARGGGEKGSTTRMSSMGCNNSFLACEYETPRCIVPEHQTLPRPRPASSAELMKNQESNYSNDYPNIRLFSNIQELLEAHYDRPPSTFRQAVLDIDGEHVYDEIPLQSGTTFTTKRDS